MLRWGASGSLLKVTRRPKKLILKGSQNKIGLHKTHCVEGTKTLFLTSFFHQQFSSSLCLQFRVVEFTTNSSCYTLSHLSCGSLQLLKSYHEPFAAAAAALTNGLFSSSFSLGGKPCLGTLTFVTYLFLPQKMNCTFLFWDYFFLINYMISEPTGWIGELE